MGRERQTSPSTHNPATGCSWATMKNLPAGRASHGATPTACGCNSIMVSSPVLKSSERLHSTDSHERRAPCAAYVDTPVDMKVDYCRQLPIGSNRQHQTLSSSAASMTTPRANNAGGVAAVIEGSSALEASTSHCSVSLADVASHFGYGNDSSLSRCSTTPAFSVPKPPGLRSGSRPETPVVAQARTSHGSGECSDSSSDMVGRGGNVPSARVSIASREVVEVVL